MSKPRPLVFLWLLWFHSLNLFHVFAAWATGDQTTMKFGLSSRDPSSPHWRNPKTCAFLLQQRIKRLANKKQHITCKSHSHPTSPPHPILPCHPTPHRGLGICGPRLQLPNEAGRQLLSLALSLSRSLSRVSCRLAEVLTRVGLA